MHKGLINLRFHAAAARKLYKKNEKDLSTH